MTRFISAFLIDGVCKSAPFFGLIPTVLVGFKIPPTNRKTIRFYRTLGGEQSLLLRFAMRGIISSLNSVFYAALVLKWRSETQQQMVADCPRLERCC